MNIVVGLAPAVFWGILPLFLRKVGGGSFRSQLVGTALGILIVAAAIHVACGYHAPVGVWVPFLLSGFCWSFGQAGQYHCYERLGVSVTMPASTALQVIGNSLIGGLFFHEWDGLHDIALSLGAVVLIVVGVFAANGRGARGGSATGRARIRDWAVLVASTAGYWLYSAFPLTVSVDSKLEGFLPQALGMLTAAVLIGLPRARDIVDGASMRNIGGGLIFSVAAATYLISMTLNGMVNAFVLSQLNVVVSTLTGAIVLRETPREKIPGIAIGLAILLAGATLMVL